MTAPRSPLARRDVPSAAPSPGGPAPPRPAPAHCRSVGPPLFVGAAHLRPRPRRPHQSPPRRAQPSRPDARRDADFAARRRRAAGAGPQGRPARRGGRHRLSRRAGPPSRPAQPGRCPVGRGPLCPRHPRPGRREHRPAPAAHPGPPAELPAVAVHAGPRRLRGDPARQPGEVRRGRSGAAGPRALHPAAAGLRRLVSAPGGPPAIRLRPGRPQDRPPGRADDLTRHLAGEQRPGRRPHHRSAALPQRGLRPAQHPRLPRASIRSRPTTSCAGWSASWRSSATRAGRPTCRATTTTTSAAASTPSRSISISCSTASSSRPTNSGRSRAPGCGCRWRWNRNGSIRTTKCM